MPENILQDKINALGSDTIMGSLGTEEMTKRLEKLQDAVEESKEKEEATQAQNYEITGDQLEALKKMGYFRKTRPVVRDNEKIGRNDPCPCGAVDENGKPKKYKNCCMNSGKYETTHFE